MKLSIVVAFYNEEKMIEKTHSEISKHKQRDQRKKQRLKEV